MRNLRHVCFKKNLLHLRYHRYHIHDSTHNADTIQNTICLMILQVTEPLTFGSLKQVSQGSFPANQSPKLNPTIRHSSCNSSFILVLSNKINQPFNLIVPQRWKSFAAPFVVDPRPWSFCYANSLGVPESVQPSKVPFSGEVLGNLPYHSSGIDTVFLIFSTSWLHIGEGHGSIIYPKLDWHLHVSRKVLRNRQCNLPRVCLWAAGWLDWLTHKGFGSGFLTWSWKWMNFAILLVTIKWPLDITDFQGNHTPHASKIEPATQS